MIVAGGAWETPRLLLRSEIANSSGLVGRYLMYHFQTYVVGSFPFRLHGHRGRSVTHLHDDHMIIDDESRAFAKEHGLPYFRAGIVEHGGGGHPIIEGMYTEPGLAHTREMLESPMRDRLWAFTIQGEDLPQVTNRDRPRSARARRARLPRRARDLRRAPARSRRVALLRAEARRDHARGRRRARRSRSRRPGSTATAPAGVGASISRHIMGTCRMGDDPRTSVVDRWQRFHDVENMVCTDSSVFPTSTGYGPTLTIVALAIRACRELAGLPPLRSSRPAS